MPTKVFLAMPQLWAYDQPCLVNRLWVPTTVWVFCFPDGGKLQGYSLILADTNGFDAPGRVRLGV
jgi:hypothetical protein